MKNSELDDMLLGRLRSVRRRKRQAHEDRDKHLLKLYREWNVSTPPVWVKLEHPYQRGWERFFVLREDVKRDARAPFYQKILDKINTRQFSRRKDFKVRTRARGRKRYAERVQELDDVCAREFISDKFTDKERAYFMPIARYDQYSKAKYFDYRFAESWRFVLCVRPNLITHVRVIDTLQESRDAYFKAIFYQQNRIIRVCKLLHGKAGVWQYRSVDKYQSPFANRSFVDILDEHWPADTDRDDKILPLREDFSFYGVWQVCNILGTTEYSGHSKPKNLRQFKKSCVVKTFCGLRTAQKECAAISYL